MYRLSLFILLCLKALSIIAQDRDVSFYTQEATVLVKHHMWKLLAKMSSDCPVRRESHGDRKRDANDPNRPKMTHL